MVSLASPAGVLGAARSFFTPPTVTPVDGPASWFAAQRTSGLVTPADAPAADAAEVAAPATFGSDVEAFELEDFPDLDAPRGAYDRRDAAAPADEPTSAASVARALEASAASAAWTGIRHRRRTQVGA